MMRANSSLRAASRSAVLQQDLLALVARELRLEGLRLGEGLAHMLRPRRRHGADHRAVVGIEHLDLLVGLDALAGDAHRLVADGGERVGLDVHAATRVQRHVEDIEIAQLCPAGSVTARLAIIGTTCSVSPPCERSGSVRPGEIVLLAAGAEHLVDGRDHHDVADAVGRQLEARARLGRVESQHRRPRPRAAGRGARSRRRRPADRSSRTSRARRDAPRRDR